MIITTEIRCDSNKTPEGYLIARATIARTGVFYYASTGMYEAKLPDDLFNPKSLETLKNALVVDEHPKTFKGLIDSKTATNYTKGFSIDEPKKVDNKELEITIKFIDADLIDDIETGKKNYISLGMSIDLIEVNGEFEGKKYQAKQTNIRYNHIAVTSSPRLGEDMKIRLDSNIDIIESREVKRKMAKLNLDGIELEVDDTKAPVIQSYMDKQKVKLDSLAAESKVLSEQVLTLENEKKVLNEKAVKLDSLDVNALVSERLDLVSKAEKVLGKGKVDVKLDSKDIISQVVKSKFPKLDIANVSDETLKVRFDSVMDLMQDVQEVNNDDSSINVNDLSGQTRKDSLKEELDPISQAELNYRNKMLGRGDK